MLPPRKIVWLIRALAMRPFFGKLGALSYIGPPTLISGARRIYIGRRVRVFPGVRLETIEKGSITIHDNVSIAQDVHITAMGDLHIGEGTAVTAGVMVTDADHEYRDVNRPIHEQGFRHSATTIGRNCFIGMGARIQAGTVLGDGCVVGANSVVRGTYPAHSVIVGAPARVVRSYNPKTETWQRVPPCSVDSDTEER